MEKSRGVTITLTQACNLACVYCYEHHKSSQMMELSTALDIVDREFSNRKKYEEIIFDLFGGEPFLAFDLLKQVVKYIESKPWDIPFTIFTTTNGTLVHGEVQTWLREHKDTFICGLSADGNRMMHDLNRSNSYDLIDFDFFKEMYASQGVKMTVSTQTLPYLSDGVIDLHNKGFEVNCNLAFGIDWSDEANISILERELNKLIEYYVEHPDIEPCSMLSLDISILALGKVKPRRTCGSGNEMVSYDIDGIDYPCQFFMPLSIGAEKAKLARTLDFPADTIPVEEMNPECRTCLIEPVCPNCLGSNFLSSGSIYLRSMDMCRLNKIIIKARSVLYAERILRDQYKGSKEDISNVLQAIINIQENLKDI